MKIFNQRILTHRKIIIIFLLAIFLPSLIAAYLSLSTFPKRREAIKKLLESNLYFSGEAALKSVEEVLLEYEQKTLNPDNFNRFLQTEEADKPDLIYSWFSEDSTGQRFLLDDGFKIIFPETASKNAVGIQFEEKVQNDRYAQLFRRAEFFEFSQKNYTRAAELYKAMALSSVSSRYSALAYEGAGRCLMLTEKLSEAEEIYKELSTSFGQFQNNAGHPYGIIAVLQLHEIACQKKETEASLGILVNLYQQIREGSWLISQPVYDFYISEIKSILDKEFIDGRFPEIQKTYLEIQKQPSPYGQTLLFIDLLERNVIPEIKEKLSLYREDGEVIQDRFPVSFDNNLFLISYAVMPGLRSGQTFYGGFTWDLNNLRARMIPGILQNISKESGLDFEIIVEGDQETGPGRDISESVESLALTFRTFPLPWKLLASHPEIKVLEKTASREIFFYGFLLAVIVALMILGAVLIARDISREAETNRLKTEFVNNISHELKTPLTLIRLYGETLQRKENLTDKEKKESYEIITRESERLSHLINNVLDSSRIEMGRKEFNFKKGYLPEIIRDTLESYRYHLEKKGFVIHSEIASDLPEMNFDGEAIASVLVNLLSNAMKFSPKEKEVTVKLFQDDGNAVLQVSDKGIGISQNEIPKIFERFYQSVNKIDYESRGSGLGLTLVKHITEAHGGKIEVESEAGIGSVFTVSIPLDGI